MISAGRLRHRVTIERPVRTRGSNGEFTISWVSVHENVPAAIEPLSVRGFLAASQVQSEVTTIIVIRSISDLTPDMRIREGTTVFNPVGALPDKVSNREYMTIPCKQGVNEG